ncbi:Flp family type IVb pilin [Novosphingobium sp.]|uniref:Flp family type IVb pilin n=1 Tax=Novosphingobium sp. TaxID=1874826 RepID=UPI001EB84C78|nr:Flp family type IVb pilin [Novosphingobium sp.]MBK6800935.1 Flp family type IVb pilin [Novosphingobium sp.]MBK9011493.1 Flp family type IVb pilin [Novosphingobium sp.]
MTSILKRLFRDVRGTSAIEMGLICSLIILAMMTALQNFASESQLTWTNVSSKTSAAIQNANAG